jgi:hypothetical protein
MIMRKLVIAIIVLSAAGSGCDATRRDFAYCDSNYGCKSGYCDLERGLCLSGDAAVNPDIADAPQAKDVAADVVDAGPDSSDTANDLTIVDVAVIDQTVADATLDLAPIDTRPADLRVPDAPGTCSVKDDCVGVTNAPYCVNAMCVSCAASVVDGGGLCSGSTAVCNAKTGSCVECLANSDCKTAGNGFCVQNKCVPCDFPGATASAGGTDGGVADGGATAGAACTGATVCMPSTPASGKAGQCVGCRDGSDCPSSTPICETTSKFTCGPCTSDSQCPTGPGICLFHSPYNGRCATDAETLYVQGGCSSGAGTATSPYCRPQDAIDAVKSSSSKRVVVISGTTALEGWTASFAVGSQWVSVIAHLPGMIAGRSYPTIVPGAGVGIHVLSGKVYVRGLTVLGSGSTIAVNPGIEVDAGAVLSLDRCYVTGNAGGLLVHDGAGFDIANSVFAQNQSGSVGAVVFGGAYLGSSTDATMPHRFWFNTVAENQQFGVACASKTQALDGCLLSGDSGGEVVNCTLAATTKSPSLSPSGAAGVGFSTDSSAPIFGSQYRLTATTSKSTTSPCKDFITDPTVLFPPDDIDGQSRPSGAAVDCGADEYWPQ